jgi:excinuclease ABC subunit B
MERRDVIVVSSVSCIYSLGDPEEYGQHVISLRPGMIYPQKDLIKKLVSLQFSRSDIGFDRNNFRVRGDVIEIFPSNSDRYAYRVELFGDEIDRISQVDTVTGEINARLAHAAIYPASHYITSEEKRENAIHEILAELDERIEYFEKQQKYVEAQRIRERVLFDAEQIREMGFCSGVENYSRVLSGRKPGSTPYTLLDFFPADYLLLIDESHVTVPQVRGMSGGDHARKKNLIDYGFRLPSAFDNRPLNFEEFLNKKGTTLYVSATPAPFERERSQQIAEQIIRPTGLLDPKVEIRPVKGQVDDLLSEIRARVKAEERVLVTTLTKKMAEDLSEYLASNGVKCRYMHHDIDAMERMELIRDLRKGTIDVLVGINLLREGLDLPEVSLVAILDADKEGFLRSETSLVQTIGRAARHINGTVIMYADKMTGSMERAVKETERRRKIQQEYNQKHGITPKSIIKELREPIAITSAVSEQADPKKMSELQKKKQIEALTKQMKEAAKVLDFETAAALRDRIKRLM